MSVPAEIQPPPPPRPARGSRWLGLLRVLWTPRQALAAVQGGRWVLPPYILGMLSSLLVWYLIVQLLPQVGPPAGDGPAGGPSPDLMWGPMGPGPQPLSPDELKLALKPEMLALAALAAPWVGGLWRGLILHIAAALAGNRLTFARSLGFAGYSMVPLWLGQVLAAGLALTLVATQPPDAPPAAPSEMPPGMMGGMEIGRGGFRGMSIGPGGPMMSPGGPMMSPGGPMMGPGGPAGASRPSFSTSPVKWTFDVLTPKLQAGLPQRLLAGIDFFHLWHLIILSTAVLIMSKRLGQALWFGSTIFGSWLLLAALQPQMPQILTWIGLLR